MLLIKFIDTLSYFITEFLYMIAYIICYAWKNSLLIAIFLLEAIMILGGLWGYCYLTN